MHLPLTCCIFTILNLHSDIIGKIRPFNTFSFKHSPHLALDFVLNRIQLAFECVLIYFSVDQSKSISKLCCITIFAFFDSGFKSNKATICVLEIQLHILLHSILEVVKLCYRHTLPYRPSSYSDSLSFRRAAFTMRPPNYPFWQSAPVTYRQPPSPTLTSGTGRRWVSAHRLFEVRAPTPGGFINLS